MKSILDIRRENLIALIESYGSSVQFAKVTGKATAQISSLVTGRKGLGEKLAREIEVALNLVPYSLDQNKESENETLDSLLLKIKSEVGAASLEPNELTVIQCFRKLSNNKKKAIKELLIALAQDH